LSEDLDEIWALYADDGAQSLDTVEAALLALRKEPLSHESVAELFRAMHTFKGNSRLLGLETIESCAHIAEDLVGLVRDEGETLDAELLEMLLEASDRLREMMEIAVNTRRDADKSISESIVGRMGEKYARMRESEPGKTAGSVSEDGAAGGDLPAEAEEKFETAVVFGAVTESLASDPTYLKIFLEIARDSLFSRGRNIFISARAEMTAKHVQRLWGPSRRQWRWKRPFPRL
jgi:two-component system chemotaxis sensor kinase CheA